MMMMMMLVIIIMMMIVITVKNKIKNDIIFVAKRFKKKETNRVAGKPHVVRLAYARRCPHLFGSDLAHDS